MTEKRIRDYIIHLDKRIGEGANGEVFYGERIADKQKCAIKVIQKKTMSGDQYLMKSLWQEIQILKTVQSQNIIGVIDILQSPNCYYIILELCDCDLEYWIERNKYPGEKRATNFLLQIVNAFVTLVQQGIIHRIDIFRDLKPANILLLNDKIKIADFGVSKNHISQKVKHESSVGTPLYMSPQLLKGEPYSSKCDVWACGLVFYQLLHSKTPWTAKSKKELISNIQNAPLQINEKLSPLTKDFLKQTLQIREENRLSWDQVFTHQIFQGIFNYLKKGNQLIQNKLKMLMATLRQEIDHKNIDICILFETMGLKNELTLPNFEKFITNICKDVSKSEIRYIFDKLDTNSRGTISTKQIEEEMKRHNVQTNKSGLKRTNTLKEEEEDTEKTVNRNLTQKLFQEMFKILKQNNKPLRDYFYDISQNNQSINFLRFKKMMRRFGEFLEDELLIVFQQIDLDKSNSIEYEQIKLAFCQINYIPPEALDRQ